MRGERRLLRLGEHLVGRSCRRLPREVRAERGREWAAELPAILHDPGSRLAFIRVVRMLRYALGTRAAAAELAPKRKLSRSDKIARFWTALIGCTIALNVWNVFQAPADWVHYAVIAWLVFPAKLIAERWLRYHKKQQRGRHHSS